MGRREATEEAVDRKARNTMLLGWVAFILVIAAPWILLPITSSFFQESVCGAILIYLSGILISIWAAVRIFQLWRKGIEGLSLLWIPVVLSWLAAVWALQRGAGG
jgi:hypothetical protein